MKLKKKLLALLSLLMMSVFLLTGCSPEQEELANELITDFLESDTEYEENTEYDSESETVTNETPETEEELPVIEESESPEAIISTTSEELPEGKGPAISEDGTYTSKEEVAAYIHEYGHLPSNFITKKQAKKLGWVSNEGNLWEVAPGKSIGGDYFGNYEGILPEKKGRDYYECDIDTDGSYRGAKRIVFSDDGLIYYTEDHYKTFELLYGEE